MDHLIESNVSTRNRHRLKLLKTKWLRLFSQNFPNIRFHAIITALHLPALPLEALLRLHPEQRHHPCAVLEHSRSDIAHANRAATRSGVHPGLSITRALARCPGLRIHERDPDRETAALHDLIRAAESLTPDFELTTPDTLLLDLPPCDSSSGKPDPRAAAALEPLGLPTRLATGPDPDLAHLFSLHPATSHSLVYRGPHSRWHSGPRATPDPSTITRLSRLPLTLARQLPGANTLDFELLAQWGLHHLDELAQLPRQGLGERLGPAALRLHDLLHARSERLLTLFHPIETFDSIVQFEHSSDSCESLIFQLKRILQTLCARLRSGYRAAAALELRLELEGASPHRREFPLPEPSCNPDTLLQPLITHLESLRLPGPVTGLHLSLRPGPPHRGQHELFDRGLRQPHRLADTLMRLAVLLGEDRLGFPVPGFSHRPDSFTLLPAASLFQRRETPPGPDPSGTRHFRAAGLPLSRFRPPVGIAVAWERDGRHPRPLALLSGPHRGRITGLHGPFPLSGDWWDPSRRWQQLEWDLQLDSGQLLRLAHHPPETWNLEGSYG